LIDTLLTFSVCTTIRSELPSMGAGRGELSLDSITRAVDACVMAAVSSFSARSY
jgi:hypothetical protein